MLSGIPGKDWKHPRGAHVAALKELCSSPAPEVQDGSWKPSPLESTRNVSVHSHSSHEVVPGCCPAEWGTKRSGVPALHHLLHTKHQTHTFRDELLSTFSSCFALRSWYGPNQTRTHRNWLWYKVDYYSFFYEIIHFTKCGAAAEQKQSPCLTLQPPSDTAHLVSVWASRRHSDRLPGDRLNTFVMTRLGSTER